MLSSLQTAIRTEINTTSATTDSDEIMLQFQRAGRDLITRQAIHHDDRYYQTSYRLLNDHHSHFADLFGALGYEFSISRDRGYVRLGPGEAGNGARRGRIKKEETLMLLTLRIAWEEGVRSGDADDYERVETSTAMLADRYTTLGGGALPSKSKVIEMLRDWAGRGLLRLGEEDKEAESAPVVITSVIADIVTEDMSKGVLEFISEIGVQSSDADDAFEYLQSRESQNAATSSTSSDEVDDSTPLTESLFDA